jgi:hypothetical protein
MSHQKLRLEFPSAIKNTEQDLLTHLEFSPPFFTDKKRKPRNYRTYSQRSVAKRGDLEITTKSGLHYFVRGEKEKKLCFFG